MEKRSKKRFLLKVKTPRVKSTTERQAWGESAEAVYDAYVADGYEVISVWEQKIYTETQRVRVVE